MKITGKEIDMLLERVLQLANKPTKNLTLDEAENEAKLLGIKKCALENKQQTSTIYPPEAKSLTFDEVEKEAKLLGIKKWALESGQMKSPEKRNRHVT
ncbi:6503_t:CDS:2 [Dentiscutata erythropus]|uniref:6503_t:CDS:1 n=1 Tax=Dentiscutata erythropus TaxID=1348616 RepID=A0A9N9EJ50_9GLOM|nr:6503_t:CDS:2 [Dentiscutata erythropus]